MTAIDEYLVDYPWLEEAKKQVSEIPMERLKEDYIKKLGKERVVRAVNNGKGTRPNEGKIPQDDDYDGGYKPQEFRVMCLLSYPAARIIVSCIDDTRITNRFAKAEAKTARDKLFSDISKEKGMSIEKAMEAVGLTAERTMPSDYYKQVSQNTKIKNPESAKDLFNLSRNGKEGEYLYSEVREKTNYRTSSEKEIYLMPVTNYADAAGPIRDDKWRLSSRAVNNGKVKLTQEELLDLFQEQVFQRVVKRLPLDIDDEIRQEYQKYVDAAIEEIQDEYFSYEIDRVEKDLFPPLVKTLAQRTRRGENLMHMERFALASFLINIGMSDDEIIEFLGVGGDHVPNFVEDVTREQLRHIRTQGGRGEAYTPPTYPTVESWGTEWEKDELEEQVEHPLHYYKIKLQNQESSEGTKEE